MDFKDLINGDCKPSDTPIPATGSSVGGNIMVGDDGEALQVAVYSNNCPNARVYVGKGFADCPSGFMSFAPDTTSYYPHPFAEKAIAFRTGVLTVSDPELIKHLDELLTGSAAPFYRETNWEVSYPRTMLGG